MVDIDMTIAAVDNMKKNFDIVPREEQIINAGYTTFQGEPEYTDEQAEAEYSGVSGEYYAVAEFFEYFVEIEYSFRRQCPSSNGIPDFRQNQLTCAGETGQIGSITIRRCFPSNTHDSLSSN
jgi:hypothetical protein